VSPVSDDFDLRSALDYLSQDLKQAREFEEWARSNYHSRYLHHRRLLRAFFRSVLRSFKSPKKAYLWHLDMGLDVQQGHDSRYRIVSQGITLFTEIETAIGLNDPPKCRDLSPRLRLYLATQMLANLFELLMQLIRPFVQRLWETRNEKPLGFVMGKVLLDCFEKVAPTTMQPIVKKLRIQDRNGISHADYYIDETASIITIYDRKRELEKEEVSLTFEQVHQSVDDLFILINTFNFEWRYVLFSALQSMMRADDLRQRRGY
jgi:hypothetical protein